SAERWRARAMILLAWSRVMSMGVSMRLLAGRSSVADSARAGAPRSAANLHNRGRPPAPFAMIDLSTLGTLGMTEIVRLQNQLQNELRRRFERSLLMAFSDIVGSTPYFARFGDAVGRQLHQLHVDLLGQAAGDAQGRIVDAVGDGVFCVFPDAEAGVRAIVAFEQATARENATRAREHQLAVRIGLHWGSVLTDCAVVTGDSVHVAARVARAAEPGGVCLTRQVFLEFGPELRVLCHPIGMRELK